MARALPQGFRRKKNGSIEYRFMIGEERFSVSGSTVKECREKERKKRDTVAAGQYIRNEKITVAEYFEEWERGRAGTVKEASLRVERRGIMPALKVIGKERVCKLERRQIVALQGTLSERYTTTGVNYAMKILKMLMKAAVYDGIILKNPCEGVKSLARTEPQARDTIHRALTQEEQQAFFEAAANEWYYEFLCFLIQTGVRFGEAGALKWSDVDMKKNVIHIRRTLTETAAGHVMGDSTKSAAGTRDIPITDAIWEILQRQRQKVRDLFGDKVVQIDGFVFVGIQSGEPVNHGTVRNVIDRCSRKAGIERIGAHAFRDTFATRAIESGMNPQTLKTILGHSSLAMTMDLYAHVMPNTKKEEMDRLKIII